MAFNESLILQQLSDASTQRQAFGAIVNHFSEPLYWKIRNIVLNHEDANDVLQNTFIKAWTHIGDFRQESHLTTWLHRIAINEALDFLRRQKNLSVVSAEQNPVVANSLMGDTYFNGDEAQALLQEAISRLPEVQRAVFTLRYFHEMKYSEMSQMLGTSEGALKASYHLAVGKVTEYLKMHE